MGNVILTESSPTCWSDADKRLKSSQLMALQTPARGVKRVKEKVTRKLCDFLRKRELPYCKALYKDAWQMEMSTHYYLILSLPIQRFCD